MELSEIKKGEGKKIEFKERLPEGSKIAKTMISFANGAGGKLIIGIKDKSNEIIGISDYDVIDLPDRISNIIHDHCEPNIIPEIYIDKLEEKNILVVEVFPGSNKPYYLKNIGKENGTYIRVGATNKQAGFDMLQELERQRKNISFDQEIVTDIEINDVDIKGFTQNFLKHKINAVMNEEKLYNLELLKLESGKTYPTKAMIMPTNPTKISEYMRVKCAKFKGNEMIEFIDQKEFCGPIFEQINDTMNFIQKYIAKSGKIEGVRRIDKYEIPMDAIREAVINAVIHRDYSISGADIKVAIFDNRIEIISPGMLPNTLELESIKKGRSEIRNKIITRVLKEMGYIEQWGSGIKKILSACERENLREPEFNEDGNFFSVVIYNEKKKKKGKKIGIFHW